MGAAAVTGGRRRRRRRSCLLGLLEPCATKNSRYPTIRNQCPSVAAAILTMLKLTSIAPFAPVAMRAPYLLRQFSSSSPFPKATSLVVQHTLTPQPK